MKYTLIINLADIDAQMTIRALHKLENIQMFCETFLEVAPTMVTNFVLISGDGLVYIASGNGKTVEFEEMRA